MILNATELNISLSNQVNVILVPYFITSNEWNCVVCMSGMLLLTATTKYIVFSYVLVFLQKLLSFNLYWYKTIVVFHHACILCTWVHTWNHLQRTRWNDMWFRYVFSQHLTANSCVFEWWYLWKATMAQHTNKTNLFCVTH